MNDDEEFLFQQAMVGVKPLGRERRAGRQRATVNADAAARRRNEAVAQKAAPNPLVDAGIEPLDPWYVLEFKRSGVQNGVYRKLRQGRYDIEAQLNLHGMTVQRARRELFEFVVQASEMGLRTVLVIHGKGENSPAAPNAPSAVIKGYVSHWLGQLDNVQAYHSARPNHGGTGAVYVLLRKGEQAKARNRERFR